MPTRAERAAKAKAHLETKRADHAKAIAKQAAILREEARKARDKRRYLVGKLVDEAGLFAWSDTQLTAVMQALAPFASLPNAHLLLAQVLIRAPLARWMQEAADVKTEVDALIQDNVTLVVVGGDGQPLGAGKARVH